MRRLALHLLAGGAILFALACSGASSAPTSTQTPPAASASPTAGGSHGSAVATPTPALDASTAPDGGRIRGYVLYLADTIGSRPAGTAREEMAASYIADLLRGFGYDVQVQEFAIAAGAARDSSVTVVAPSQRTVASVPFDRTGAGRVRGQLVDAGRGAPADFPPLASGNVVLIERGEILFNEKVANAQAAGARGVIVFNNEQGTFLGGLAQEAAMPVVSISQAEGKALRADLAGGLVQVELAVGAQGTTLSRNVVARPPGRECETVSGGHYDSVVQGPGASDNASGAATVIEVAGVLARRGEMGANCFVLFGSEEPGLLGSRDFVAGLDAAARSRIRAMINYDMVGVGNDTWELIGSLELQQRAADLLPALGIVAVKGQLPNNTSSDHASFIAAGIPSLMIYRLTDTLLHTPQDVSARVRPELLEEAARIGLAVLASLAADASVAGGGR